MSSEGDGQNGKASRPWRPRRPSARGARSTHARSVVGLNRRCSRHVARSCLLILPYARAEAGEERGAERGRLDELGARDLDAEHVGLELHQQIVRGGAAVDLEHAQRLARVALHRAQDVDVLQRDALERRARDVRLRRAAREAGDRRRAPRVASAARRARRTPARRSRRRNRGTERASASISDALLMMPRPSRSHCTAAPAMNAEPSSA